MFCKVIVTHSELDETRLRAHLKTQFKADALPALVWKAKSQKYKDLRNIENIVLWGSEAHSLYGLIQETPNMSIIWIEYSASKDSAFSTFRAVLQNFANAIMKSQKKLGRITRNLKVAESRIYVENENDPLGVTVRILKEAKNAAQITLKELVISGVVASLAIFGHYQISKKSALQYLTEMNLWALPIPVYGWFAIISWGILIFVVSLCTREVEVKFDA